jgi:hypothetical protein
VNSTPPATPSRWREDPGDRPRRRRPRSPGQPRNHKPRAVLAGWDAHLAVHGKTTPGEAKRDATIADLKKRLAKKTQEHTL